MAKLECVDLTCAACPSQWDAWDELGRYYYIRYRYGWLTVNVGEADGPEMLAIQYGDRLDGVMNTLEMQKLVEPALALL